MIAFAEQNQNIVTLVYSHREAARNGEKSAITINREHIKYTSKIEGSCNPEELSDGYRIAWSGPADNLSTEDDLEKFYNQEIPVPQLILN